MTFFAQPYREMDILALAKAYQDAAGFHLTYLLAGAGALAALVLALFIPAHHAPEERHPSLPE